MGQAKRRGTYQQRKEQRYAKQYGLTNAELNEAYLINKLYNLRVLQQSKPMQTLRQLFKLFGDTLC